MNHAFVSRSWTGTLLAGLLLASSLWSPAAVARERRDVPKELTWDLSAVYADEAAWKAARTRVEAQIPELARFQGHLDTQLGDAFTRQLEVRKELERLSSYASFLADQDTRDSAHQAMRESANQLYTAYGTAVAYFDPEVLALGETRVQALVAADARLKPFAQVFREILRAAPHTLSPAEEKVAAQAGDMANAGESVHSIFTDAELPYPEVKLSDGKKVRLDAAGYTRYRALPNRADRVKVFQAFWGRYQQFRQTLATTLNEQVKAHLFNMRAHKYASALEAALEPHNVPTSVYRQLLSDVHANLPTLHRYLKLRRKLMKLPALGYEDLYAPIIPGIARVYTPEQAKQLTLAAEAPLGEEYQKALKQAYDNRWVDFLPSTGKRSGAYSSGGVYDVHPFQLLNFNGAYEDVSTLGHESGHSLHSYLSNKNQPYGLNDYPIFVAEVASTLNENLLFHYTLDHTQDKKERLALLGSYLEGMRGTLFRQALLAEFELTVHERAEKGEPLTGDSLNELYLKLLRTYYGHDAGVCKVDALYAVEWAYIPHFYYNFYVYQYSTSMLASTSLAARILDAEKNGDHAPRDAYLQLLSAGASDYPINLLKKAGVDMTSSQPFNAAMKQMNEIMDEIEKMP